MRTTSSNTAGLEVMDKTALLAQLDELAKRVGFQSAREPSVALLASPAAPFTPELKPPPNWVVKERTLEELLVLFGVPSLHRLPHHAHELIATPAALSSMSGITADCSRGGAGQADSSLPVARQSVWIAWVSVSTCVLLVAGMTFALMRGAPDMRMPHHSRPDTSVEEQEVAPSEFPAASEGRRGHGIAVIP